MPNTFPRWPRQPPYTLRPRRVKWSGDHDLLTLKVVSESRVTWPISVPILVFLGLCSQLSPNVRDRRQPDRRQTKASLNDPAYRGRTAIATTRTTITTTTTTTNTSTTTTFVTELVIGLFWENYGKRLDWEPQRWSSGNFSSRVLQVYEPDALPVAQQQNSFKELR